MIVGVSVFLCCLFDCLPVLIVSVPLLQVEPDARVLGSKIKRDDWTFEQDMVFEHAMAEFDETVRTHKSSYCLFVVWLPGGGFSVSLAIHGLRLTMLSYHVQDSA